jgi:hypothetical protein
MDIAVKMADSLRSEGYDSGQPKPGKACDAGFACKFDGFVVDVIVMVERVSTCAECAVRADPFWSFWRRARDSDIQQWERLCADLHKMIETSVKPTSLSWLTFREAEKPRAG